MQKQMEKTLENQMDNGFIGIRGFPILGVPFFGAPHTKDYSKRGSISGVPSFGELLYGNFPKLRIPLRGRVYLGFRV